MFQLIYNSRAKRKQWNQLQSYAECGHDLQCRRQPGGACSAASRSITFVHDTSTAGVCKYNSTTFPVGSFITDISGQEAVLSLSKAGLWKLEDGASSAQSKPSSTWNSHWRQTEPVFALHPVAIRGGSRTQRVGAAGSSDFEGWPSPSIGVTISASSLT
jgi:hypothetical protein